MKMRKRRNSRPYSIYVERREKQKKMNSAMLRSVREYRGLQARILSERLAAAMRELIKAATRLRESLSKPTRVGDEFRRLVDGSNKGASE